MAGAAKRTDVRIVFFIDGLDLGGAERQLFLMLKHIDKTRFDCHVLFFHAAEDYFVEPLRQIGVTVWSVPHKYATTIQRLRFAAGLLRRLAPDVVHSWSYHDNVYAGLAGRLAGVPIRLGSQRSSIEWAKKNEIPLPYRLLSFYAVSCIVVNSKRTLQEYAGSSYGSDRLHFIPNCLEMAPPARSKEFGIPEIDSCADWRIIGTVGNIRRQKNHLMFVQGMARVCRANADVRAVIIGREVAAEPQLPQRIRKAIGQRGAEARILLAGFKENAAQLMRNFTVFCLTSDYEGRPNVLLEALAAGCPVVATAVGDVPQIIDHGENGLLVPPGDDKALTETVQRLLDDPRLARRLGDAGHRLVSQRYDCQSMAEAFTEFYESRLRTAGNSL